MHHSIQKIASMTVLTCAAAMLFSSCSVKQQLKRADRRYKIGEYHATAPKYKRLEQRIPAKNKALRGEVCYKMGNCYRKINDVQRASAAYRKAIRYKIENKDVYLYYADVLLKAGQNREARSNYYHYLRYDSTNVWAQNGVISCDSVKLWNKMPQRYSVKKMDVLNSRKGVDFCPVVADYDGSVIYFSSSRVAKGVKGVKNSKITGIPNNNIYIIKRKNSGKWEDAQSISDDINTTFDEGACSLSPDGKAMYFTKCRYIAGQNLGAEIWKSQRSAGEWGEPKPVTIIGDSSQTVAHPAIAPNGRHIYFVSDRIGGYGGNDIWRCEIINDHEFGIPENLGPEINTSGDEMFPSFGRDGTLYFSSNGHPGFGGLDIYAAKQLSLDSVNGYYHYSVKNMMAPINSAGDDFGITFIGKSNNGYFSSNRNEPKGYDKIYSFGMAEVNFAISGTVTDYRGNPLQDAYIRIVGDDGTNAKINVKKDGSYLFELKKDVKYIMLGSCRGHLNQKADFSTKEIYKTQIFKQDFVLPSMLQPVPIDNIFFDFARYTLRKESEESLNALVKMLNDNPHITIEIAAHTDMVGSEESNMTLSEKRAQSVVNYLISAGIDEERLSYVGYGESLPVRVSEAVANEHPFLKAGDVLTEEFVSNLNDAQRDIANQINRRIEFTVTKTTYKMY